MRTVSALCIGQFDAVPYCFFVQHFVATMVDAELRRKLAEIVH